MKLLAVLFYIVSFVLYIKAIDSPTASPTDSLLLLPIMFVVGYICEMMWSLKPLPPFNPYHLLPSKYEPGQAVIVLRDGNNDSLNTMKHEGLWSGVYQHPFWQHQLFTIVAVNDLREKWNYPTSMPKFSYTLAIGDVIWGCIYEDGVKVVSQREYDEYLDCKSQELLEGDYYNGPEYAE